MRRAERVKTVLGVLGVLDDIRADDALRLVCSIKITHEHTNPRREFLNARFAPARARVERAIENLRRGFVGS
jgi:hypothetical protein